MSASITAYISSPDNKYLCIIHTTIVQVYSLLFQPRCMGKRPWQLPRRTICISKRGDETSESRFQVYDNVFAQLTCATKSRTIEFLFVLIQLHIASADGIVFRCCGTSAKAL